MFIAHNSLLCATSEDVTLSITAEGNAFCADYVYASVSVFAKVESVEVIEVDGLAHKAIKVTLKY